MPATEDVLRFLTTDTAMAPVYQHVLLPMRKASGLTLISATPLVLAPIITRKKELVSSFVNPSLSERRTILHIVTNQAAKPLMAVLNQTPSDISMVLVYRLVNIHIEVSGVGERFYACLISSMASTLTLGQNVFCFLVRLNLSDINIICIIVTSLLTRIIQIIQMAVLFLMITSISMAHVCQVANLHSKRSKVMELISAISLALLDNILTLGTRAVSVLANLA